MKGTEPRTEDQNQSLFGLPQKRSKELFGVQRSAIVTGGNTTQYMKYQSVLLQRMVAIIILLFGFPVFGQCLSGNVNDDGALQKEQNISLHEATKKKPQKKATDKRLSVCCAAGLILITENTTSI